MARSWRFIVLLAIAVGAATAAQSYYASPAGGGDGLSPSSPCRVTDFWSRAQAGSTLYLLDGIYTGSSSMIRPPQNLSGTATARITVRALNDGKVTIDGQGVAQPISLSYNNFFIVEGINACNSVASVVSLSNSSNCIVRRVAAWDAADGNHSIFGVHFGTDNLLEDVAGWGIARKIYESSQGGNRTTIRRSWGRWEGSHVVGPKMTYTLAYNNTDMIVENALGTWSGERMKQTYTLLDYYGKPWTGTGAGTYTDYAVDQPYGIFGLDGFTGSDKNARTKLLGSLAYARSGDRFHPAQAVFATKVDSLQILDTLAYFQPGSQSTKRPFALYNLQTSTGSNLSAINITGVGAVASFFGTEWKISGLSQGSTLGAVANPFTASANGAHLGYRYQNGQLTNVPLWPWPMNQRIIDATKQSGRAAVDVTATIESMLGQIPPQYRSDGSKPFSGTPLAIPGVIQAENFDAGGEGVAYHDLDSINSGGAFRATGVDVESTGDSGGGYDVGWTRAGEWLAYSVNVSATGAYALEARVASSGSGGTFHVEIGGIDRSGPISIPATGGWQTYVTVSKTGIALSAGQQVLKIIMDSGGAGNGGSVGNINFLKLSAVITQLPSSITYRASSNFSAVQGEHGWSYLDSTGLPMTFDAAAGCWRGPETYLILWAGGGHPGNAADAVLRWTAPQSGSARITGNAHDLNPDGGEGVTVLIKKGSAILWQRAIANGDANGFDFDVTATVSVGDTIDFVINRGADGSWSYDSTYFDPTIVLAIGTPISNG